jgi:hypothetical protein
MSLKIDERRLQRLVDGEMSPRERREFLEKLDAPPDAWRSVALAFVEDRVFSREIAGVYENAPAEASRSRPTPARGARQSYAVTAACAALALCAGFLWGRSTPPSPAATDAGRASVQPHAGKTPNEAVPQDQAPVRPVPDNSIPQHRVQFVVGEGDAAQVIEVPAYTEDELRALAAPTKGEIAVQLANQQLRRLGYRLEPQTQFLTGTLKDGRELMLPVQTMTVSYDGQ